MAGENRGQLSLPALVSVVVGSMVGAGIFNLPGRFSAATGPLGAIVSWIIAGTGMYTLARIFQMLARERPDIDSGVFSYAKEGFGNYLGFLSAFGYWLGSCLGNVFYWVLICATLSRFFPEIFGTGSSLGAIAVALLGIWTFHLLILRGVEQATFINTVVTIAKIVPLLVAIVAMVIAFNADIFRANFHGGAAMAGKPLWAQVRDTMLITVFVFLGIEGASVYSRHAKKRADVGTATLLGFLGVTGLMVAITLLPYGVGTPQEIAGAAKPSLAGVLELAVGPWGALMVSLAVLVAVLGAYLAWTLMGAEVLYAAAQSQDMPRFFAGQNRNGVPARALWATNALVSLFVISTHWSSDAFNFMLDMASVTALLPYLLVAGYGVLVARGGKAQGVARQDLVLAWIAVAYTLFMFVAAGLQYLLLTALLYVPGSLLYAWARRERGARLFAGFERRIFVLASAAAVAGLYGLATGRIVL